MKDSRCYWCGGNAVGKEHVPPRSFFPKKMRDSLITVPACRMHNEDLGKLDEKFRFCFQATADSEVASSEFQSTTLRGFRREEARGFRTALGKSSMRATLNGKETVAFEISKAEMDRFSEKLLRGLYYHHYSSVFTGEVSSVCTHIHAAGFDIRQTISEFSAMRPHLTPGSTKNQSIFRYECGRITEEGVTAFAMICIFYEHVTIFGSGLTE